MYHGPPDERAELRRTVMREPDDGSEAVAAPSERIMALRGKAPKGNGKTAKGKTRKSSRVKRRKVDLDGDDTSDDEEEDKDDRGHIPATRHTPTNTLPRQTKETFPVVVTTYEMIIRDQPYLSKYNWGYIVVDEGHRLKNLNCRLIQEIKKYPSAGRMILTGTPLHVRTCQTWVSRVLMTGRITLRSCGPYSTLFFLTSLMTWTLFRSGMSAPSALYIFRFRLPSNLTSTLGSILAPCNPAYRPPNPPA